MCEWPREKTRGVMGKASSDIKEIRILNRIVRLVTGHGGEADTIEYESDPRHVELLLLLER